eukprot:16862-Chlamydomonas_euryale.AAC.1
MRRLDERLSKTKYWDQTAFNEEVFFLSHGKYKSPQVGVDMCGCVDVCVGFKASIRRASACRAERAACVQG